MAGETVFRMDLDPTLGIPKLHLQYHGQREVAAPVSSIRDWLEEIDDLKAVVAELQWRVEQLEQPWWWERLGAWLRAQWRRLKESLGR